MKKVYLELIQMRLLLGADLGQNAEECARDEGFGCLKLGIIFKADKILFRALELTAQGLSVFRF